MAGTALILLAGLEIKHYIADYLLQPGWLLKGKGSLTAPGGYVHAAIHIAGSLIVLLIVQVPLATIAWILAAEFVAHYAIDFVKYRYGSVQPVERPALYWALHGLDQLLHQLTYLAMIGFSLSALGLWS
jgi:hypothetical protein